MDQGVHNEVVYVSGHIPSDTYDPKCLANLSFGFTAVDFRAGYTYLDLKSGREFAVLGGLTYSGMNNAPQYQNGIDFHLIGVPRSLSARPSTRRLAGYLLPATLEPAPPSAT